MAISDNAAVYWTKVALEAIRRDFTVPDGKTDAPLENDGPTQSSRALALIQLAMHDAYFSVVGSLPTPGGSLTWMPNLVVPAGVENADAALAGAAHAAIRGLFRSPAQTAAVDMALADFVPAGAFSAADFDWGKTVAASILADREPDHDHFAAGSVYSNEPYRHRPDPFSMGQPRHGETWGNCRPFVVERQELAPPPGWSVTGFNPGAFYQAELQQVIRKGALTGHTRKPADTVKGIFWAYDGADKIGTPPRLYCQIGLTILDQFAKVAGNAVDTADYVRLLTLMATAMADAGIQAWHWKYQYDLWRPVHGVREADSSFGPNAPSAGKTIEGHPDWAPLGAPGTNRGKRSTPPFPAYPSGHATFGAAAFQVIRRYAELRGFVSTKPDSEADDIAFEFVSDEFNGKNRDPDGSLRPRHRRMFKSLWAATIENSVSRLFLGVHWLFDGISKKDASGTAVHADPFPARPGELGEIGGVWLGREIANKLIVSGLKRF